MSSELPEIEFSELAASDLDAVVAIERQSFERPWTREHFARELASDISRTIVARGVGVSKAPIGYVCRWLVAGEIQVLNLAVHKDHRRRGIGRQLMRQVLDEAGRTKVGCVTLEVRDGNVEAVALYESIGFNRVGWRHDYYGEGRDGVLMTLTLEPSSRGERT